MVVSRSGVMAMPGDKRLRWLLAAHLVLGVFAGVLAPVKHPNPFGLEHILVVPLFASALCQAFLLALWGSASTAASWKRTAGLVAGAVYLEALPFPDLRREFLGLSTVTVALSTASLLVGRALGIRVTRRSGRDQPPPPETEGLRFSIRGLMLLTAVVALLSAGARLLAIPARFFLWWVVVWSLCFVVVGLVALWAALGAARPLRRAPALFAISPVCGSFFAYAVHTDEAGRFYIILIMLLYPAVLLGSLLVVRSCNYRLVRRTVVSAAPEDSGGPTSLGQPAGGISLP